MLFHLFGLLVAGTRNVIAQIYVPRDMLKPLKNNDRTTDPLYLFPKTDEIMSFASGTRLDCEYYHWYRNTSDPAMANCYTLSILYTIEFKDFILWNPSLADTSTTEARNGTYSASVTDSVALTDDFMNSCTISSNRLYCVGLSVAATSTRAKAKTQTPAPRAPGEIANCTMWFDHYYEARCEDLMLTYGLYFDEFYEMNPSVKADCSGLVLGMSYCRSTYPGGREVGIPGWHSDDEDDDEIDSETYQEL